MDNNAAELRKVYGRDRHITTDEMIAIARGAAQNLFDFMREQEDRMAPNFVIGHVSLDGDEFKAFYLPAEVHEHCDERMTALGMDPGEYLPRLMESIARDVNPSALFMVIDSFIRDPENGEKTGTEAIIATVIRRDNTACIAMRKYTRHDGGKTIVDCTDYDDDHMVGTYEGRMKWRYPEGAKPDEE